MTNEISSMIPYLKAHLVAHPSTQPQDIAKLCYQAAHGAEHLLADLDRARSYLLRELEATEADGKLPLIEPISDAVARVNLAPWKAGELSVDLLFDLFVATATVSGGGDALLESYLNEVTAFLWDHDGHTAVTFEDWMNFLTWYKGEGCPAIHHSHAYRQGEWPAYRIVMRELLRGEGFSC